ncbi:hypothetical protein ABT340_22500 [Streptosporangium sp. NPDC000239]|uniref:hypothetical protein n=1 Tax=Streptosporangium sp. NPDC000239 TaxID=3154248 RepID=UPI00331DB7A3
MVDRLLVCDYQLSDPEPTDGSATCARYAMPSESTPPQARQIVSERITVGLVPRVSEQLQRLQERTGFSKTDLVNRAITLYEYVEAEASKGNDLLIRQKDNGELFIVKIL